MMQLGFGNLVNLIIMNFVISMVPSKKAVWEKFVVVLPVLLFTAVGVFTRVAVDQINQVVHQMQCAQLNHFGAITYDAYREEHDFSADLDDYPARQFIDEKRPTSPTSHVPYYVLAWGLFVPLNSAILVATAIYATTSSEEAAPPAEASQATG